MSRVLVVEDDRFNRRLYRDLLEGEGFTVELADSAASGLAAARAAPPAVVVMDLELPDLDGVSATARLKADPRTAGVPVVVVSAHAQADQEARARAAGASAFLAKPLAFAEFLDRIRALVAEGSPAAAERHPAEEREEGQA